MPIDVSLTAGATVSTTPPPANTRAPKAPNVCTGGCDRDDRAVCAAGASWVEPDRCSTCPPSGRSGPVDLGAEEEPAQ